jgi:ligand-binding sensor domain-containing protein/signal transduction histidine kinase
MKIVLVFFFLNCGFLAFGQELFSLEEVDAVRPISQYAIKQWNMNNGLPNNAIMDIQKTSEGFMWLATFNGLTRFDGLEFKVFNRSNTPELITNTISSLAVDHQDNLWIGTNGGGLVKYHKGKFELFESDSIDSSIITALEQGGQNDLWVGTRSGLVKLENQTISKVNTGELRDANITALFYDYKQRLWVGTASRGLYLLDNNSTMNLGLRHGLQSNFIRAVFVDSKDNVWVGSDRGVAIINADGIQPMDSVEGAPTTFTNRFLEDIHGNIWLASSDGLRRYNQKFEHVDPSQDVGHHIVQSLFQDEETNIWAGTYRMGLHRLNQSKFLLIGKSEGLSNEVINVTYADDSMCWAGTDAGLICLNEGKINTFSLGRTSSGNRVRDILRDSQGRFWVCTYNGLVQFDNGKVIKKYTVKDGLVSNNTRRIVEDKDGNLWVGTANGLSLYKDGQFLSYGAASGLIDQFIMSIYVGQDNVLWVGTNGGGTYRLINGKFQKALSKDAAQDVVFNITQDDEEATWLSTNRGIIYLKDTLEFNILPQHGLIGNNVFQVLFKEPGQVWIASDHGIMRASKEEILRLIEGEINELSETRSFDRSDGLRTGQITPASLTGSTNEGEMWFCTLEGMAILQSSNIPINEIRANILVTKVLSDISEHPIDESAVLPAGNQRLEFHYAGLSYFAPEKVQYKYKLENFDQNWVNAGSRRAAFYTNIPPGDYQFKVMASNNDGLWSEFPATVSITQRAYFYQTLWFYLMSGILLIAFGAFLYYLRAVGLRRRNYQLARMVQERTRSIQNQNEAIILQKEELNQLNTVKDKLLSVISHDLRGPIAAVSGLLGLLKSGHLNYQELITQSSKLNNEVHSLTYLLDNLLSWSKSQMQGINLNVGTIQLVKVVDECLKATSPISEQKRISVFNNVPANCYVQTDINLVNLAIRNLVMNALKFTHEQGEIDITAEDQDDQVLISVNDNGVGMTPDELSKLFNAESHYSKMGTANEAGTGIGLLLCKEFIELDGGKIWAVSQEGKGSSFKFLLKKGAPETVTS